MPAARTVLPIALLLALVGAAGALAAWSATREPGATDAFRVVVEGPEGTILDREVLVENATALSALEAAARDAGVPLSIERYPGMGAYVRAIGPWRAEGGAGWIYEIGRDGAWSGGTESAATAALARGDALRWRWVQE